MVLNTIICEKFRNAFEQRCFQLIVEAYQTSLTEQTIKLDWNENDISSELHRHIIENPLRQKWRVSTNREAEITKSISKVKGFSDTFPRIDFRLTTITSSYEYEYSFEAKNLKQKDSKLKRRYIRTGIDNFVSKKYESGSLIGYLLEGKINATIDGINYLLKRDKRKSEILSMKNNKLFKDYFESSHPNIGVLKHIIFDFTNLLN